MTNIRFPVTDLVKCVFCYRSGNTAQTPNVFDAYDRHKDPRTLKEYTYRVPEHLKGQLAPGDAVIVHCQTGYQLCEVVEVNALSDFEVKTFAPVVSKVDLHSWVEEVEKAKQLKAMKAAIDAEKRRLESMVTYELIAEKNPEFKAMLEQFKAMGGEF